MPPGADQRARESLHRSWQYLELLVWAAVAESDIRRLFREEGFMFVPQLVGVFMVLQFLDGLTTSTALSSGLGREMNPVMLWLFGKLGMHAALYLAKIAISLLIAGVSLKFRQRMSTLCLMAVLCVAYVSVVINNFQILMK
jgi:hypothetical protein